jgi:hypothetical protein
MKLKFSGEKNAYRNELKVENRKNKKEIEMLQI